MFKNHPKGLLAAALSNMGERFGYYIMNAVLLLFLCSKFGLSDETSGVIYAVFYALIYVLSLIGGYIADKTQNYKATIMSGLVTMAAGYALLSIPILATPENTGWLLPFTCGALLLIAFGNGLFKGNLQAIVGQMYDDPKYSDKRDSGFQIFYVFINIGGLVAPFIAPLLRSWWLGVNNMTYNAGLPELCHDYINAGGSLDPEQLTKFQDLAASVMQNGAPVGDLMTFSQTYLDVFNTGVHYSFFASVAAMLISLLIFVFTKKNMPNPAKKEAKVVEQYTQEEKLAWFSFHQNGQSLSVFARDFVTTESIAPEIWQAVNPFFVITLTPIVMWVFSALRKRRGKDISTPRKIAIGMLIAGIAYLFLTIFAAIMGYPSGEEFRSWDVAAQNAVKAGPWVLIVTYFFLTVAELFISPLGLSFVSKVAPKNLQGICQGLWLGATAVGNLLIWIGPLMYNSFSHQWMCWLVFMVICLISMGVMLGMVKWLERITMGKE